MHSRIGVLFVFLLLLDTLSITIFADDLKSENKSFIFSLQHYNIYRCNMMRTEMGEGILIMYVQTIEVSFQCKFYFEIFNVINILLLYTVAHLMLFIY